MVGKIVIAECEWWKFNFPRLLILLILTPTILSENCSELQAKSQATLKDIHSSAHSLRKQWELREKNTRELLKNVSDYIIRGIVKSRHEIDKIYSTVDLTGVDFGNMDCRCQSKGTFDRERSEYTNVKVIGDGRERNIYEEINHRPCDGPTCTDESTLDTSDSSVQHKIDTGGTVNLDPLVCESITAFRNNDYDKVTSSLNLITDDNSIYTVVNSVYKQDAVNAFTILINLSDKLINVRRIFLLYNAIHNEMEISKDSDAFKYLILIEHINGKVLHQKNVNEATKEDARNLLKVMRAKTKQVGIDFLRSVFEFKNSTDIKSGNELLNKTYYSDESLFEEIHEGFLVMMKLNGMYNETFNNVLKLTKSRLHPEQELLLHVINIFVIKNYDEIDTAKMAELFKEYLKFLQEIKAKINEEKIQKYSGKLKTTMPLSLYNMLSSEKLCIKNVGLGTYLNAGGGTSEFYKYSSSKRNVYLSEKCSPNGYGIWKMEHVMDDIYYPHKINHAEYPYAARSYFIEDRRVIWMWIGGHKNGWCYWHIELTGDYVYIKNNMFKEYLYGSSRTGDSPKNWYKGHVYTLRNATNVCLNQECVWSIEDCSNTVE